MYRGIHWIGAAFLRETVGLRPGRYRLDVASAQGTAVGATFTVAAGATNQARIVFP